MTESIGNQSRLDLRQHLRSGLVVGDGAMATMLHQSGVPVRACYEELSVLAPALVENVHRAYIDAGATVIQTNTFSAHRVGLSRYGLEDQVETINQAAVRVARQASQGRAFVLGTVGSTVDLGIASLTQHENRKALAALYEEQLATLLAADVDGILLETFADLWEMNLAVEIARKHTALPIVAHLSPDAVGVTRDGYPIADAFDAMLQAGADVVGLNCKLGLSGILRTYESLALRDDVVYSAMPNAGHLHLVDGQYSYTASAEYFAEMGTQLAQLGVGFIGGCCGTTPEHIRCFSRHLSQASHGGLLQSMGSRADRASKLKTITGVGTENIGSASSVYDGSHDGGRAADNAGRRDTPRDNANSLLERVKRGLTVIVELDPPKTLDVTRYLEGAVALRDAGADYVTLADNSLGTVRVSNMALASILKGLGVDPLVHVTCRDRNLIGQQSHLMGLHVLGVDNILLVTGDPSRFGDLPGATSVYDVSSIELTKMVQRLNHGVAFSGQSLKHSAAFTVGTSFNPNVTHFEKAAERLRRKVDAGAAYVMTQPIFEERMFEQIAELANELNVPIFAGVMPIVSARNAYFLHNEVPGIHIPEKVLQRIADAPLDGCKAEGLRVAEELIDVALNYFHGLYLVTPFLQYDLTVHLTKYAHQVGVAQATR